MNVDQQLDFLRRGTTEIISEQDLKRKLGLGRPLRVKLGVDPTARDVTLGWAVVLRKLRDFQTLGHTACLIIGNFTAQIGDPSGKSKTRRQLSPEEVQANVDAVMEQIGRILDRSKTEIFFNGDWLGEMKFSDVIRLCSRYTVARILERDDFTNRLRENRPISMHEILYPLCQGMDSVEIVADVEIGGSDQKFNNLVGRTLMEQYDQEAQVVVLCPLLVGTDGKEKMSQSLGNYVSITDSPNEMFGKTMSIPDNLIENWYELCTDVPMGEVRTLIRETDNPRDVKRKLAAEIVALYHGQEAALEADQYFVETFSKRKQPVDAEEAVIPADLASEESIGMAQLISRLELVKSTSEARRLMQSGAVSLDAEKISDPVAKFSPSNLAGKVLRVGKHRFVRLAV
jgi:tyrosyl-tRNA synthetase